ncbi:3-hydroxybutyryl-CoA dehydrogenase [Clostridium kluyveri]|uniref:3-hydroxybutyryl-CoA dehydrogenase n=1 Tax=Clostridium kluyveri TaxID=1534 RepID=A0A1L5FDV0_CLOKL|nr:3-hydroxybutyryl-CoA dehydrogenase [Clostridium kluyveri]APM41175.1 3-hydroxybutyryl-CoA dehydrogenase [Clostridium kluyveri]UZQ52669.1 3-hydroxybutyryl-CoA dehydrogenase [Clostridium kluyveri]
MKSVAVLGSGTMSRGIVQAFAEAGVDVIIRGRTEGSIGKGLAAVKKAYDKKVAKGKMSQEDADKIVGRVSTTTELEKLADCDLIIEAASEDMNIKKDYFGKLEEICKPETIFATNTSSLSITEVATSTKRQDKFIGMHFFNPANVMKLVEIIRGMNTSQETFDIIKEASIKIGKTPVEVAEAPGFVVNKILVPMINEAVGILAEGIASAEDIDTAMKLGANHPMGPLALGDLIGLDVVLAVMDVLYNETGDSKYRAHTLLRKYVRAGWLGRKSGKGFFAY